MKQMKWLIGLVLLVGLVLGGVLVFDKAEAPEGGDNATKTETVDNGNTSPENAETGEYVDYSEGLLTNNSLGTKILFFHAPWCPQCRELDASIKAGEIPAGVTIIKVDYDSHQSLRSRYGVTIQTTLVRIDDNGDLVKKYVAYDEPSLESLIENVL